LERYDCSLFAINHADRDVFRGSIETPLMHKRNALEGVDDSYHPTAINRLGTSEECGNLIAWLLSDESKFVSGATYAIDGGW
jgi:NAD(P)-dependent dehydrogenase (short-subunit alcohol dehydrogenase family)